MPTILGESTKQLDNSHLQHVVIHLGTNYIKKYDEGEIMINATSAVEKIKKSAPHVDVTFCSLPPRKGTERAQKTANDAASNINNYLKAARSLGMFRSGHTSSGCSRSRVRSEPHKNWYNQECENKRKIFIKHKNKYRRLRNNNNLQQLR